MPLKWRMRIVSLVLAGIGIAVVFYKKPIVGFMTLSASAALILGSMCEED